MGVTVELSFDFVGIGCDKGPIHSGVVCCALGECGWDVSQDVDILVVDEFLLQNFELVDGVGLISEQVEVEVVTGDGVQGDEGHLRQFGFQADHLNQVLQHSGIRLMIRDIVIVPWSSDNLNLIPQFLLYHLLDVLLVEVDGLLSFFPFVMSRKVPRCYDEVSIQSICILECRVK